MTDEPGVDRDAEEQERVRRLLAAARHDEPAPPDVVARLDAALAAEAARRPGPVGTPDGTPDRTPGDTGDPGAPVGVVDLDARRRRRRRTGLLAAAAVVVAGVGLGAAGLGGGLDGFGDGLGGGGEESSAGGSAADLDAPASSPRPEAPRQEQADPEDQEAPGVMGGRAPLPVVRTGPTLADDVTRALRTGDVLAPDGARCAPTADAGGDAGTDLVAVRADGTRAELVASPESGGSRDVALFSCAPDAADTPLATLTVPAG